MKERIRSNFGIALMMGTIAVLVVVLLVLFVADPI
jgi:hypothetical protein